LNYEDSTGSPLLPGSSVGSLSVYATTGSGYLPDIVITLSGTVAATSGYLVCNQTSVSFGGVFIGGAQPSQASKSIVLSNDGGAALTFTGFAWQDYYVSGSPYNNVTSSTVGNGYTATSFPAVGSTLAAGASITIPLVFLPSSTGLHATYLTFWSSGGYTTLLMQGNAQPGTSSSSSAPPSTTSISISQTSTSSVLSSISSTSSTTTSNLISQTSTSSVLSGTSTTSSTTSSVVVSSSGPSNLATIGTYSYVGCYTEATTGRALTSLEFASDTMTIEVCYATCSVGGYSWFGIEYHRECKSFKMKSFLHLLTLL
jgi:hypothetical protein